MTQLIKSSKLKFSQFIAILAVVGLIVIVGAIVAVYSFVQSQQVRYPNSTLNQICPTQNPQVNYDSKSGIVTIWAVTISCVSTTDSSAQILNWFNQQMRVNAALFANTTTSAVYNELYGYEPVQLTIVHIIATETQHSQTQIFITTGYQFDLGNRP